MKKLVIFNELALFNAFTQKTDFTNNLKMLEKLHENGIYLALMSTIPHEILMKMTSKKGADITRIFQYINIVNKVYDLNDYLKSIISWGKRKRISPEEMVYFGCSLHPDYSAANADEPIDFIGVITDQTITNPFTACASIPPDKITKSSELWKFLPEIIFGIK